MKPRILLVDDEPAVVLFTAAVLRRENFEVATAASAEEAISQIERETFDLVITDFRMRGKSGDAVVLAARAQRPETPVIIITGCSHDLPGWLRSGPAAVRIVDKPFSTADFCQAVDEALVAAP
jgi:DNA-binding NtrC family response regulator